MRKVTVADLKVIADGKAPLAGKLVGPINKHAAANGIVTELRMSHFLAHMAHETAGFSAMVENLNYTTPGRIMATWPSRFKTRADEKPFLKNPQALANKVYNGRLGNRVGSNDGWDYRGGGPYQLTGRSNYRDFGDAAGVDLESNPELARDPDTGVEVAAKYFAARMMKAADRDDINGSTVALNGGTKGLADRKRCLARAKRAFGVTSPTKFVALDPDEPAPTSVDDITSTVEPEPQGKVYTDEHRVSLVQTWLRNLGYPEVGVPNGKIGPFTEGVIRDYRADKGLPPGDFIDDQLMLTLATDTEPRKLPESRTEATPADVREKVPEAQGNFIGKITGWFTSAGAAVVAAASAAWDNLGEAKAYLEPIKDFVGDVPTWLWFVAVAGAAFMLSRKFAQSEQASIDAFKTGARR